MLPLGISLSHHFMGPTLAGRIMKSTQSHQISSIMRKHEGTWKRGGQLGLEMCVCKGGGGVFDKLLLFCNPTSGLSCKQTVT